MAAPVDVRSSSIARPSNNTRLVLVLATLGALLLGEILLRTPWPLPGQLLVSAFLQLGPGVVWAVASRALDRMSFALVVLVAGPAIVVLVSNAVALTGIVPLGVVRPVLFLWTAAALVVLAWRTVRELRSQPADAAAPPVDGVRVPALTAWLPTGLAALGVVICLVSAAVNAAPPQRVGVAIASGPFWFVGFALAVAGVLLALVSRRFGQARLAGPVLMLASVVVASQAIAYREPTVAVTGRHLGLVDFLLVNGQLDRSSDIYQAWAGLFSSAAVNLQAIAVGPIEADGRFGYATWWAVAAAPLLVFVVRCLAGRFLDPRRAWLAALVFGLGSSLTTTFFAPQVLGFVFALAIVALLVRRPDADRLPAFGSRLAVAVVLSVAMALTHQISPFLIAAALFVLGFFRLAQPRWAFLVPLLPAVAWALANHHLLGTYLSWDAIGALFSNVAPPERLDTTFAVPLANRLTFGIPALALVVIGVLAIRAAVRTRDRLTRALIITAASPLALLVATSYGQEGIFRVALFALPWLAILACVPATGSVGTRTVATGFDAVRRRLALTIGLGLLAAVQVVGLTGMDWARVLRTGDVAAITVYEQTAPVDAQLLSLGTTLSLPTASTARYTEVNYLSRTHPVLSLDMPYPVSTGAAYDAQADLDQLTERFASLSATAHYAIAADSVGAWDERYGYQRAADHQALSDAISRSPRWELVYRADGVALYRLRGGS